MTHGTRSAYQRDHCRCVPCRAAEATYRRQLRLRQAKRLPVLGQYISASEAWARIRALKAERVTHRRMTGRKTREPLMTSFTPSQRVRLKTLLRLRKLCHYYLIPDDDLPNHTPVDL